MKRRKSSPQCLRRAKGRPCSVGFVQAFGQGEGAADFAAAAQAEDRAFRR